MSFGRRFLGGCGVGVVFGRIFGVIFIFDVGGVFGVTFVFGVGGRGQDGERKIEGEVMGVGADAKVVEVGNGSAI